MLAAFSRELADHRAETRRFMTEESDHVNRVLEQLQLLVTENDRLRIENARLENLLCSVERESDRPSVAIKILQAARSDRPPSLGALLRPTNTAGWVRLVGAGVGGLGIGSAFVLWHFLVK
jgi:chromosome segregation ATPase